MFCHFHEDDFEEWEERDDISVMFVSSMAVGWGLGGETDLGERIWELEFSPTLTRFFILSEKYRWGEEGERLTEEGRELVGVGGNWDFPLIETGGHSSLGG